jgi:hypothetical protein
MEEHTQLERSWGSLTGAWTSHNTRDQIIDFVQAWSDKTEIPVKRFIAWIEIAKSKFHTWKQQ